MLFLFPWQLFPFQVNLPKQTNYSPCIPLEALGSPLHLLKAECISLRMTGFAICRSWYFKIVKSLKLKHILRKVNAIHIIRNFKRGERTSFSASFFAFPLKSNEIDQTKPMKHEKNGTKNPYIVRIDIKQLYSEVYAWTNLSLFYSIRSYWTNGTLSNDNNPLQ